MLAVPTIVCEDGYEVQINTRDHPPPHVHVRKAGGEARYALENDTVELLTQSGMKASELKKAAALVAKHYVKLQNELGKMSWVRSRSLPLQKKASAKPLKRGKK